LSFGKGPLKATRGVKARSQQTNHHDDESWEKTVSLNEQSIRAVMNRWLKGG